MKSCKAACKCIPCFPTNFLITKSCLSPSYAENPTWGMCKIVNVFWLLTLMIGRNLSTQKHTFQRSNLKTFYFITCLFVGLCILCVKMKTFLCEESVLPKQNKLLPVLPRSLLNTQDSVITTNIIQNSSPFLIGLK